jgi:hypothetical protein
MPIAHSMKHVSARSTSFFLHLEDFELKNELATTESDSAREIWPYSAN